MDYNLEVEGHVPSAIKKLKKYVKRDDDNTRRNMAMGIGGAAPFAGLIGQKKTLHDPLTMPQASSYDDVIKALRPGDVLLTGGRQGYTTNTRMGNELAELQGFKPAITAAGGHPEAYHTTVVGNTSGAHPTLFESDPGFGTRGFKLTPKDPRKIPNHMTVFRPKLSPAEHSQYLDNIASDFFATKDLGDSVSKVVPDEMPGVHGAGRQWIEAGMYDKSRGLRAGLKELFLPKLGITPAKVHANARQMREGAVELHDAATREGILNGIEGEFSATRLQRILSKVGITPKLKAGRTVGAHLPACAGRNCSNLVAAALPEGRHVLPNVLAQDILPKHFFQSEMFEPVIHYNPTRLGAVNRTLAHLPNIVRGGVGLGVMGGIYGGNKLYRHIQKQHNTPMAKLQGLIDRASSPGR